MKAESRLLKRGLAGMVLLAGLATLTGCGQMDFFIATPGETEGQHGGGPSLLVGLGSLAENQSPGADSSKEPGDEPAGAPYAGEGEGSAPMPAETPTDHPPATGHSLIEEPQFLASFWPASESADPNASFQFGAELSYSSEGNTRAGVTAFGLKAGEYAPDPDHCDEWTIPEERPFWHDEESFAPGHNLYLRRGFTYQDDPEYVSLVVWARVWGHDHHCAQRIYSLVRSGPTPAAASPTPAPASPTPAASTPTPLPPAPTPSPTALPLAPAASTPTPLPPAPTPGPAAVHLNWTSYVGSDVVRDIAVEAAGAVWSGGDDGLYRWDLPACSQTAFPMRNVRGLVVAADGDIWAATFGDGVYRYDGTSWTNYTEADGLANDIAYDIAVSPRGGLWFATGSGLSFYKDSVWTSYTSPLGVTSIAVGVDGSVWCGTYDGVWRFDGQEWEQSLTDHVIVWSLDLAVDGAVWAGTSGSGVYVYDGSSWTRHTSADGLCEDTILSVVVEQDDTVWAGGNSGACRFDGETWTGYTAADGLPGESVPAMVESPSRDVWLASGSGIALYVGR